MSACISDSDSLSNFYAANRGSFLKLPILVGCLAFAFGAIAQAPAAAPAPEAAPNPPADAPVQPSGKEGEETRRGRVVDFQLQAALNILKWQLMHPAAMPEAGAEKAEK